MAKVILNDGCIEEYLPGIHYAALIDQSGGMFMQFDFHFFRVVGEILNDLSDMRVIVRCDGIWYNRYVRESGELFAGKDTAVPDIGGQSSEADPDLLVWLLGFEERRFHFIFHTVAYKGKKK